MGMGGDLGPVEIYLDGRAIEDMGSFWQWTVCCLSQLYPKPSTLSRILP